MKANRAKRMKCLYVDLWRSEDFAAVKLDGYLPLGNSIHPCGRLSMDCLSLRIGKSVLSLLVLLFLGAMPLLAATTGTVAGTVRDMSGAVMPNVSVEVQNLDTSVTQAVLTNSAGFYSFPSLAIGRYSVSFKMNGFQEYKETGLTVNVNSYIHVDAVLKVGTVQQQVQVEADALQINTTNAQMGDVIEGKKMVEMPLNGRSYTDLMRLQPGVAPGSSGQYSSGFSPSGNLNGGSLSIAGNRENFNGFTVNGANVEEGTFDTAAVVPNLDSIAEFRIITNNGNAEYGNYAGGQVNVATKSGTNEFHGNAFEFWRNRSLDATDYFNQSKADLHQHQFGGTIGGPILRRKLFFFGDYQGTRRTVGESTGLVQVPSAANRTGDLSDSASQLTGTVGSDYFAGVLSSRLGYAVSKGEPYYSPGCVSSATCVFPNAQIPQKAWAAPAKPLLPYIPAPTGVYAGVPSYITNAYPSTLTDNKGAIRIDADSRFGRLMAYYLDDQYESINPYGDSSVPGFSSSNNGSAHMLLLGDTTTFGSSAVNQFNIDIVRNLNHTSIPIGGEGVSLDSLGFATPANGGIYPTGKNTGVPQIKLKNIGLVIGVAGYPDKNYNTTYQVQDDFSKVIGSHSLKFGANYHYDLINARGQGSISNGQFKFYGNETGSDFADMLIGSLDNYAQGGANFLDTRNWYLGLYAQDTWRASSNLTLNYGIRWDVLPFWSEAKNRNPTYVAGEQSQLFPTAPRGYVFPGDPGIPSTFTATKYTNFSPRVGFAFSPSPSEGLFHRIFGGSGTSSIRAGFGIYYTSIEGQSTSNTIGAPPYGYYYSSPARGMLFDRPFINRFSGAQLPQPFPVPLPPANVSPSNPYTNIDWSHYFPISSTAAIDPKAVNPYMEIFDLSIERRIQSNTVLTVAYVGTLGRHLVSAFNNNPGIPSVCLALSQSSQVKPGTQTCGPGGQNEIYYPAAGGTVSGTRAPFGIAFGGNAFYSTIGNSSYNSLQSSLRHSSGRLEFLISYTLSRAFDNSSGYGEQVYPFDPSYSKALSGFDVTHSFVASYTYELPFDRLFRANNRITRGWKIGGITTFATGFPVTMEEDDDNSLLGSCDSGPNGTCVDMPNYTPGKLLVDTNPRHGKPYFNTSLFSNENLGQMGNSRRRFFHGPGQNNWDLTMLKDLPIKDALALEFRAEFFNAFNHAQFSGADAVRGSINSGHFGLVVNDDAPRIGQLAVKLKF